MKEVKLKQVSAQRKSDEAKVKQLKKDIDMVPIKIEEKKKMLAEKEPQLKRLMEGIEQTKKLITPDNLKKVYAFLDKKSAEPIAFVMEAVVGLLRGQRRADTKSVELYIQKHEGFMIGLNRLNYKKLNTEYLQENL